MKSFIFTCLIFSYCFLVSGTPLGDSVSRYRESCPNAGRIVRNITWTHISKNSALPARLLRMHFHDCFVRGCDDSILIDSTANKTAEKDAVPNLTLSGFDVIDEVKSELEQSCPGVVSCADVLALSARDAVSFQFKKPMWKVWTGRRDGSISSSSEAAANIPSPFSNLTTLLQRFASKGLGLEDLVHILLEFGHCIFFSRRLYNFTGKGDADPSLDSSYAAFLKTRCKGPSDNNTIVEMDKGSALFFDNNYFTIVKSQKGLFQSDASLLTNSNSARVVDKMVKSQEEFFEHFAGSMKKMGRIGVLTGKAGEVRRKCSVINS